MYNPANLYECEKVKFMRLKNHPKDVRRMADTAMTGIGLVASVSNVPQVIKIFETGTVAGVSLTTQLLAFGTIVAWFFYSILKINRLRLQLLYRCLSLERF